MKIKRIIAALHLGAILVDGCVVAPAFHSSAAETKIKIVLVGDSTMTENTGWGLDFKQFLNTNEVELINTSKGGRSSISFVRPRIVQDADVTFKQVVNWRSQAPTAPTSHSP